MQENMNNPISIYIHIPFCVKKCAYCDFASFGGCMDRMGAYVDAVCREIRAQAAFYGRRKVRTVFFGGGTPSLLSPAQMQGIMDALRESFYIEETAEISMECNPGTVTAEKLCAYRAAGINRLSIGVQSMDDALLSAIGRIHTKAQDLRTLQLEGQPGVFLLNPPYGERLSDQKSARELYREIGLLLKRHPGWKLAVITADPAFERSFGRRADKKRRLYNGRLECEFYIYN